MEKIARIALLNDLYGGLLTAKQQEVLELFYNQDYSLGEIAALMEISRQGVHDTLRRSEQALEHYEEKLGLMEKMRQEQDLIERLKEACKTKDWSVIEHVVQRLEE